MRAGLAYAYSAVPRSTPTQTTTSNYVPNLERLFWGGSVVGGEIFSGQSPCRPKADTDRHTECLSRVATETSDSLAASRAPGAGFLARYHYLPRGGRTPPGARVVGQGGGRVVSVHKRLVIADAQCDLGADSRFGPVNSEEGQGNMMCRSRREDGGVWTPKGEYILVVGRAVCHVVGHVNKFKKKREDGEGFFGVSNMILEFQVPGNGHFEYPRLAHRRSPRSTCSLYALGAESPRTTTALLAQGQIGIALPWKRREGAL